MQEAAGLGLQRRKVGLRVWLDGGVGAILDWRSALLGPLAM